MGFTDHLTPRERIREYVRITLPSILEHLNGLDSQQEQRAGEASQSYQSQTRNPTARIPGFDQPRATDSSEGR